MRSWFVLRAKAAWLLGFLVVLAGFVSVLLFIGQALAGIAVLPDALPQVPSAWLDAGTARLPLALRHWMAHVLPSGFGVGVLGLLAMMLGAAIARRQIPVLEAEKRGAEDRLRRVRQYAGGNAGDGRIEPYIGSPVTIAADFERR
jgi:hypothetical protein